MRPPPSEKGEEEDVTPFLRGGGSYDEKFVGEEDHVTILFSPLIISR